MLSEISIPNWLEVFMTCYERKKKERLAVFTEIFLMEDNSQDKQ